jgi:hypothetical protein
MNRGQDNGATILLGPRDCRVVEVVGGEEKVVMKTDVKERITGPALIAIDKKFLYNL